MSNQGHPRARGYEGHVKDFRFVWCVIFLGQLFVRNTTKWPYIFFWTSESDEFWKWGNAEIPINTWHKKWHFWTFRKDVFQYIDLKCCTRFHQQVFFHIFPVFFNEKTRKFLEKIRFSLISKNNKIQYVSLIATLNLHVSVKTNQFHL